MDDVTLNRMRLQEGGEEEEAHPSHLGNGG